MRTPMRRGASLAWLAALILCVPAMAGDPQVAEAKSLYDNGAYLSALTTINNVDRSRLSSDDAATYDRLLGALPEAIRLSERGEQDKTAADAALAASRWDDAERLYRSVVENQFARGAIRDDARAQLARVGAQKQLSEAARPSGPEKVAEPAPAAPVQTAPPTPVSVVAQDAPAPPPAPASTTDTLTPLGPQTMVDELRNRDNLLWQRAIAKMNQAIEKAGEAAAKGDYDEARKRTADALNVVEANRIYAQPASQYEAARDVAKAAQTRIENEAREAGAALADTQRDELLRLIAKRETDMEAQRREKIEQLFKTALQLQKERRFRDASESMNTLLQLDPANSEAAYLKDSYDDASAIQTQRRMQSIADQETQAVFSQTEEVKIPWTSDILYPRNWLEIIGRPTRRLEGGGSPGEDFELNRKLEDRLNEVHFENQPLSDVIANLTELGALNVNPDWQDLESNAIERDKPVNLHLKDVTLRTAINEVLSQVGGDVKLGFHTSDGVVRIASKDKLNREKFNQVYDIRDLIVGTPNFTDGPHNMAATSDGPSNGRGPSQIFGDHGAISSSGKLRFDEEDGFSGTVVMGQLNPRVQQLMDIIRTTVEPDSWRESGGGQAALRELNGQLIVYQTSEAQRQVKDLLGQLRDTRALMIGVEARFLIVSSNFLEELGVDLDFVFNQAGAGFDRAFNNTGAGLNDPFTGAPILIPRQFSRSGTFPTVPGVGQALNPGTIPNQPFNQAGFVPAGQSGVYPFSDALSPIGTQQNSINLTDPRSINTGIPGSFANPALTPAMSIAGSFLDNLQVDFLIRATQANRRSSIVQAPRLMMFNGQRAWVAVSRSRQYVSSVTAQVAEGAVAVQPVIATTASGTVLDVEGTIGADRRYVTITVRTELAEEPAFERFQVQGASGNSPPIFTQLLDQQTRAIRTTVSIPDGGTVLLGGLKQVGEIEIDAGVPILSKIPILKRAFTNTTSVKDLQTLLILLKAKILIQKEAEDEAFPTFSAAEGLG